MPKIELLIKKSWA